MWWRLSSQLQYMTCKPYLTALTATRLQVHKTRRGTKHQSPFDPGPHVNRCMHHVTHVDVRALSSTGTPVWCAQVYLQHRMTSKQHQVTAAAAAVAAAAAWQLHRLQPEALLPERHSAVVPAICCKWADIHIRQEHRYKHKGWMTTINSWQRHECVTIPHNAK